MNTLESKDFRLGPWIVAPRLNSLSSEGKTVHLEPKVMNVLVYLADAGDVVAKERLISSVWAGTFVTDDVLTRSISELRKAFEDDPKNPRYIQTIPKGGYRLLVPPEALEPLNSTGTAIPVANGPELSHASADACLPPSLVRTSAKRWTLLLAAILVGTAILALVFIRRPVSSSAATQRAMLAVLPFQNINNDPSQDYFVDGLTAELISQLGRLPSDHLGVIAWKSMMRYKGVKTTDDEIGRKLGVNYVFEGTVRREGQHVRITAELVKIGSRSHIWANSFDGDLSDVLALQTRVAREIASEIQPQLTPEQEARLDNPPTVNVDAYDAYLKSKALVENPEPANKGDEVVAAMNKVIRLSPSYAPAYVTLAVAYRNEASNGLAPSKSSYDAARAALETALHLDPNLGPAHSEMAWVEWRGAWNFAAADREFRRALELAPGNVVTHDEYGLYLKSAGRYEEALQEASHALELNPLEPYTHANAGTLLGLMNRFDSADEEFHKALQLDPNESYIHERFGAVLLWQGKSEQAISEFRRAVDLSNRQPEKLAWLAYADGITGNRREALRLLEEVQRNPRQQYVSPFYMAMIYVGLKDQDSAFSWLEKAYQQHDEWLVYLKIYPEFASLHSDPRFSDLVRGIGLP